jgi:signal transduction histidine kinase/ActR/RegA family two-component response regulator
VFARVAIALIALGWLPIVVAAAGRPIEQLSPLTTAREVRELTAQEVREGRAVKLKAVITHTQGAEGGFYLQDATAGLFVLPMGLAKDLQVGDQVEVEGKTREGESATHISAHSIKRIGTQPLPPSELYDLAIGDSPGFDGRRVHARAIVLTARSEAGFTYIDVYNTHGRAVLKLAGLEWTIPARRMRNETVDFEGVCVSTFRERQIGDMPIILVSELPRLSLLQAEPADGAKIPAQLIGRIPFVAPHQYPGTRRVKIGGAIVAKPFPNMLYVQDSSGGAAVWTDNPTNFEIGNTVEAYGLLRIDGKRVSLSQSQVSPVGGAALPEPVSTSADALANGQNHAVRVRLAGRAESINEMEEWTVLTLVDGGVHFAAYVPGRPDENGLGQKVEIGSQVSLVGVPADVTPYRHPPSSPGVYLDNGDAVTVEEPLSRPPQSVGDSSRPASLRAAYVAGGLAAAFLVGGCWLATMRRHVRKAALEAKHRSEEKAELERQLRQSSKLEAVGRLAGGIAHDFNNLLTVINGCAELLEEETTRDGGRYSDLTSDIRRAGERAASLTGQLLTFTRKREVHITAIDLNDVVVDTVALLERVIGEGIRIEMKLAPNLPAVRGEAGLFHQVLMNLSVNAKDAMPTGGVIAFRTELVTDPTASLNGRETGRTFVRLTVADTGVGMSDEVKALIFEPFFTTKAIGSGTGLGLATVASIVQTLHGRIRVDSKLGAGTQFTIDLRTHSEPASEAEFSRAWERTPLPPSLAKLAGRTVLVVEDNEMVRATILTGLRNEGATVLASDRPDDALRLLASHSGPVDVLVTDVVMPGMSGPALAERARESRPDLRVVFMSGYTGEEVMRQGIHEDQVDFLQKPFTPDNLLRRLLRVLGRDETHAARA